MANHVEVLAAPHRSWHSISAEVHKHDSRAALRVHDAPAWPDVHRTHPERVHVEVFTEDLQTFIDLGHGHQHVLYHVFFIIELLETLRRCQLQERNRRRQHPTVSPTEERAFAERDNVLHLPEHRPAVPVVVVAERHVLSHGCGAAFPARVDVLNMPVEVRLLPFPMLVESAVITQLVREVSEHDHSPVLGKDEALHKAVALASGIQGHVIAKLCMRKALL
mmetsp:Transcript_8262/g.17964  ORF Transcript_8262/g.17964 Transcript_8262/m.17964 type:complete len:221 (+) Transcript_8262:319-981(+)